MENLFELNRNENIIETEDKYEKYEKIILEAYYHIDENKGSDFRNTFVQIYNYWLKLDKPAIKLVTDFAQGIHTATLLEKMKDTKIMQKCKLRMTRALDFIKLFFNGQKMLSKLLQFSFIRPAIVDDIQDSSGLRRGIPAAHVIYGVGRTIVATDFSRYKFFFNVINNQPTEFVIMALNCIQKSLEGLTMEVYWRDNFICPSEEEYFDMISKNYGHILLSVTKYMQLYSKTTVNLNKLTILLGMYLQIADDYRGLKSQLYFQSKGFCDDIREGKFIFPVIYAIKSRPKDTRILNILKMRTTDIDLKKKCLELLEEFGSMEYTRNKLNFFKNLIIQEMKQFEFNESFKGIFENQNYDQ